jgi:hypothetical protein
VDGANRYQRDFDQMMRELETKAIQLEKKDRESLAQFWDNNFENRKQLSAERCEILKQRWINAVLADEA